MRVSAVKSGDESIVRFAAGVVLKAYDGKTYHWKLKDSEQCWKIHFGVSAGVVGVSDGERRVCVKLFYDPRFKARLRNTLKLSKAKLAYRKGLALNEHGIPCPAMIGYAEAGNGMGLVITELADDFMQVDRWIKDHGPAEILMQEVGRFIRHMHEAGVTHKDLSPRNILMKVDDGVSGDVAFLLLDYEDSRILPVVSREQRMTDLHHFYERIYLLMEDELRHSFVAAYADEEASGGWVETMENMIQERPSKYTRSD